MVSRSISRIRLFRPNRHQIGTESRHSWHARLLVPMLQYIRALGHTVPLAAAANRHYCLPCRYAHVEATSAVSLRQYFG